MTVKIDSGSGMNTVSEKVWHAMKTEHEHGNVTLYNLRSTPDTPLVAYGDNELAVIAQFEATVAITGYETDPLRTPRVETVTACKGARTSLMSRDTAEYFDVLRLGMPEIDSVEEVKPFPMVPNYVVNFDIDHSVRGHCDMTLRIPLAQRAELKKVLNNYQAKGIIGRVPKSVTPKFISPQFFVPKSNGTLRLVSDCREANKALRTVNFTMPTLEGFLPDFAGSDTFSLEDIQDAFLHLPIGEESKLITVFNTPWGLFWYNRLYFGFKPAPTEWQRFMSENFADLAGVAVFMDDLVIHGRGHDECLERTKAVWKRCEELNLTLNKAKSKLCQSEITFLGMRLDKNGIHPTFDKLQALKQMRPPSKVSELRGFLGLLNFFSTFIPNLSERTKKMRQLLKKSVVFAWNDEIQAEFEAARQCIESSATRAHFNRDAYKTFIITDASRDSLSAIMTQMEHEGSPHQMIMCASRQTTPAEANYGQDGLEAAAVAWILPKWAYYVLARHITLFTDAAALTYIYSNGAKNKRVLCRANSFALKVAGYDFDIEHIPGLKNPADPFSRLSLNKDSAWEPVLEMFEIQAADQTWKKSIDLEDVKERTRGCAELCKLVEALETGHWDNQVIKYKPFENELSVQNGIVVRKGSRIVPPVHMRQEILDDAHKLHPGIVTVKRFIRQRAWWPGLDAEVERLVTNCYPCLLTSQKNPPAPLQVPRAPEGPWEMIAIDLHSHEPLKPDNQQSSFALACQNPGGKKRNLFVIIDIYSRFMLVYPTVRTDTEAIISLLEHTFMYYGRPEAIRSDNGPPFQSTGYKKFLSDRGIEMVHSTPLWPQANANVERAMRTINDRLRKGAIEDKNWRELMREFNQRYNEWPHSQTNVPPFTMMHHREPRLALPSLLEKLNIVDEQARDHEQRLKMERKWKTDKKRKAEQSPIKAGDLVVTLADQADKSKIKSTYTNQIWRVLERNGCELFIQAVDDVNKCRRRHVNLCKLVPLEAFGQKPSSQDNETISTPNQEAPAGESMDVDLETADQMIDKPTEVQLQDQTLAYDQSAEALPKRISKKTVPYITICETAEAAPEIFI